MERYKPIPALSEDQLRRFWQHVDKRGPDECWPWIGCYTVGVRGGDPYGIWTVKVDGKSHNLRPPRVSWTLANGPIPDGLTLDHVKERCTNSLCCNPKHTEPVTQSVNSMRRSGATATVCANGHEREPNTRCVICRSDTLRRYGLKHGKIKDPNFRRTPKYLRNVDDPIPTPSPEERIHV